jgi:hypothetical protein
VDTITDSHGYHDKKDNGVGITTYQLSGKVMTQLFVRSYVTAWWTTEIVVPVSPVMTFLSKWHYLMAPHARPDQRSNHD